MAGRTYSMHRQIEPPMKEIVSISWGRRLNTIRQMPHRSLKIIVLRCRNSGLPTD